MLSYLNIDNYALIEKQELEFSPRFNVVTGESGAGLVRVVMNGRHDVRRVSIDPSLLAEDREMLEDLVAAAVNDAVRKVERTTQERMAGLTSGLGLPPGMKLPF